MNDCVAVYAEACSQAVGWSPHLWWAMPAVGAAVMFFIRDRKRQR